MTNPNFVNLPTIKLSDDAMNAISKTHIATIKRYAAYKRARQSERIAWEAEVSLAYLTIGKLDNQTHTMVSSATAFFNAAANALNKNRIPEAEVTTVKQWLDNTREVLQAANKALEEAVEGEEDTKAQSESLEAWKARVRAKAK